MCVCRCVFVCLCLCMAGFAGDQCSEEELFYSSEAIRRKFVSTPPNRGWFGGVCVCVCCEMRHYSVSMLEALKHRLGLHLFSFFPAVFLSISLFINSLFILCLILQLSEAP